MLQMLQNNVRDSLCLRCWNYFYSSVGISETMIVLHSIPRANGGERSGGLGGTKIRGEVWVEIYLDLI